MQRQSTSPKKKVGKLGAENPSKGESISIDYRPNGVSLMGDISFTIDERVAEMVDPDWLEEGSDTSVRKLVVPLDPFIAYEKRLKKRILKLTKILGERAVSSLYHKLLKDAFYCYFDGAFQALSTLKLTEKLAGKTLKESAKPREETKLWDAIMKIDDGRMSPDHLRSIASKRGICVQCTPESFGRTVRRRRILRSSPGGNVESGK